MMILRRVVFVLGLMLALVSFVAYAVWGVCSTPLWFLEWLLFGTDYIPTYTVLPLFGYTDWAICKGGLRRLLD